jgi:Flp pilus assembly protein TadG
MMKHRRERGNSIIEFSLMAPWLILLFIGAMDWGFYAYALIATEAAARVACLYTSGSASTAGDASGACKYAIGQLNGMPNVGAAGVTASGGCTAAPVTLTAALVTGTNSADGNNASSVSVTYVTPVMIPVIWGGSSLVPKQVTITRTVQMRLRG